MITGEETMDNDVKIHVKKQQYMIHSESYAPIPLEKRGTNKPRFSIEVSVWVEGGGWDKVDPRTYGNELIMGIYKFVLTKEMMGYEHTGYSSEKIKDVFIDKWENWPDD